MFNRRPVTLYPECEGGLQKAYLTKTDIKGANLCTRLPSIHSWTELSPPLFVPQHIVAVPCSPEKAPNIHISKIVYREVGLNHTRSIFLATVG